MQHEEHEAIARWERRWLNAAGLLLVLFVILVAYTLATEGGHIAQRSARTTPEALTSLELFENPGVEVTSFRAGEPLQVTATVIAQAWNFVPAELVIPAGAEVTFYLTSRDVLHAFQVENTTINAELIPGEIATLHYTFDEPGVYRTTCNEYCGFGHHNMMGTIRVLRPGDPGLQSVTAPAAGAAAAGGADGEGVYAANCASCHQSTGQGVPGAFPPLVTHAAELYAAGRDYLPKLLLYGLEGEISVEGSAYNGQMPAWGSLSDEELAATLNYVLSAWGNDARLPPDFTPYTPEEIAGHRAETLSAGGVHTLRGTLPLTDQNTD